MDSKQPAKTMRIGEVLMDAGLLTEEQLKKALAIQKQQPVRRLGDIFVQEGFITEDQKLEALGKKLNIEVIDLNGYAVDLDAVSKIPYETARKYSLLPIGTNQNSLIVVISDPLNFFAIEDVRQISKMQPSLCLARQKVIEQKTEYYYSELRVRQEISSANEFASDYQEAFTGEVLATEGDDAPVVRVLNSLLIRGFNSNASDIHIEPFTDSVSVRIRVDGVIIDYTTLQKSLHNPLIARIKILSGLDIAEKRSPQDGHFRMDVEGTDLNVRVSLIPTIHGEKAVLRFLNSTVPIDRLGTFGMTSENHPLMLKALSSPNGIVYITGPTGSAKTTTLYMILEYLAAKQVNITTIEDPVERNIARVNQSQVNPLAGLTFETGLRSILRQDPDIIMVGETRDAETATISIRAAITGHLVLSTLHTNDAASSIIRLADMGVPSYLISSSVVAVMAQRLVRKICPDCSYTYLPDQTELDLLGAPAEKLTRGRGCNACNNTGYRGRIAIHEIILIDRDIRELILAGATSDEIFDKAQEKQGTKSLRQGACELVQNGMTSIDEMLRVAYYSN